MTTSPFQTADRYVTLKKQCMPASWGDTAIRFNEMILAPLISFSMAFLGQADIFMLLSTVTTAYNSWSEWIEFQDLRFQIQNMYLMTMMAGGPFIRTNDPEYQAFVYADAVVRLREGMVTAGKHHRLPE
jgi:hypothetical protein